MPHVGMTFYVHRAIATANEIHCNQILLSNLLFFPFVRAEITVLMIEFTVIVVENGECGKVFQSDPRHHQFHKLRCKWKLPVDAVE